jgi:hemoglobin/transferrin/lactoferrin receptor protein
VALLVRRFVAAAGSVLLPAVASAQMAPSGPAPALPEVAVTATRIEESVKEIPATITVIDSQQIDRGLVQSIQNLFRYEPGIAVNTDPNRFGAQSINIRGLEGNRVLIQVDGVRAPNLFTFGVGPFNTSTRNMVDLDTMKRVEVLRGPASTLYGSEALGGVVSYITKDPLDYLNLAVAPGYGAVKTLYTSASEGWQTTAIAAAGTKEVQGLVMYTYYTGHETENFGTNEVVGPARTAPNPLDAKENNWLVKLVFTPNVNSTLKFTFEQYKDDSDVDILSLNGSTPKTSALYGQDSIRRLRGSVNYDYVNPGGTWFHGFSASVYQQTSTTDSDSQETRTATSAGCSGTANGISTCYIPREFDFQQTLTGGTAQFESLVNWGAPQRILWGGELYETRTSALRNATVYNLTTGTVSNTLAGDTFPVRDFPNTTTMQVGLYVQDQISFMNDRLVITPALRYDYYDLTINPDAIYNANVPPGVKPSDFSDSAWSPKLSAMYSIDKAWNVYGNYAFGFRAPPFDDVNAAFRNPIQSYVLIPNPDLKSETSQGIELGVKGDGGWGRLSVAAFYNRYRDFIDSRVALNCPADPLCVPGFFFTFQSVNRARVTIYGAEAKGEYVITPNWSLAGSIAYAHGEDTTLDQPLNSISPLTGVAGVRYAATSPEWGQYGGAFNMTAVQRKSKSEIANVGTVAPFPTPGFATFDVTAYWTLTKYAKLAAGVFNIFDRKYWLWSDVNTGVVPGTGAYLDRYTQPGINASVSLQLAFP